VAAGLIYHHDLVQKPWRSNVMKIAVLSIALLFAALPLFADTYTWEDDQGTVNFTEDLGNVPPRYRKKVKIVGDVELPPAEAPAGAGKAQVKEKAEGQKGGMPGAAGARQEKKKTIYGGKESEAWKSESAALEADLKYVEKQLAETRSRLKDTSSMSRTEYLTIQSLIRSQENSVLIRKKKLEDFRKDAEGAGVPAEVLE
jgi:hypothetical protein